ncbi:MAG: DedA family protein [Gammaproteobacteria bacterium]
MDTLHTLISFVLHIDEHLIAFVTTYGMWTYALLFMIIFCESGIIFAAFLPGDSLLFATGALTASMNNVVLNIHVLFFLLVFASVSGNGLNYFLGQWTGPKVFRSGNSWIFNKKHIENAHTFYERYGGKAIIIARFIPIIRTVVPFIAGVGSMTYRHFFIYNLLGALLWIGGLVYGSYLFGNIPFVKQHFSMVILAIIAISLMPPVVEVIRHKLSSTCCPQK